MSFTMASVKLLAAQEGTNRCPCSFFQPASLFVCFLLGCWPLTFGFCWIICLHLIVDSLYLGGGYSDLLFDLFFFSVMLLFSCFYQLPSLKCVTIQLLFSKSLCFLFFLLKRYCHCKYFLFGLTCWSFLSVSDHSNPVWEEGWNTISGRPPDPHKEWAFLCSFRFCFFPSCPFF